MKRGKKMLAVSAALIFSLSLITSCGDGKTVDWRPYPFDSRVTSEVIAVETVADIPEAFIFGMDASCVPALEAAGVRYYDHDGAEKDVFAILAENGVNYIRVRVWNDPFDADGNGYGGGNCDIENAIEIGKRATAAGMKLLVDFHYSDFWADPGKQMTPKAWRGMLIDDKAEALRTYTEECLRKLTRAGVEVGMVQIGNETCGSLCGESTWPNVTKLMSAGAAAVRKICPEALVAVHFTNPEKAGRFAVYGKKLNDHDVDYDVFASSYYPYWHGTMENLAAELSYIAKTYGKKVMVAETSYAFTTENTDHHGNTVTAETKGDYPYTIEGQAAFLRDLTDTVVNQTENGIGIFYWEGTWISVGRKSYAENRALWETHGAGWASSFAGEYDPDDAGLWYGGCAVENQALFDENGRATEALKIFGLLRNGGNE